MVGIVCQINLRFMVDPTGIFTCLLLFQNIQQSNWSFFSFVGTIERDDTRYQEAVVNIHDFNQEDNITIYHEDALEFDDTLLDHAPYDCLFIDAAKAQYQRFFEKYVPYLKEDGFVLVDNLDFHGMIFDIPNIKNRNTRALVRKIKRFKDWIFSNDEYLQLLPDNVYHLFQLYQHEDL